MPLVFQTGRGYNEEQGLSEFAFYENFLNEHSLNERIRTNENSSITTRVSL